MPITTNQDNAGGRLRGACRSARLLMALPLLALLGGACEGDNLFNEGATDLQPRLTNLTVPDPVPGGDLAIRVEAFAVRGVTQIVLTLRGAVTLDTVVDVNPPEQNVSKVVTIQVPAVPPENELFVQARVIDALGKSSRVLEVVATVDGASSVISANGAAVAPGEPGWRRTVITPAALTGVAVRRKAWTPIQPRDI